MIKRFLTRFRPCLGLECPREPRITISSFRVFYEAVRVGLRIQVFLFTNFCLSTAQQVIQEKFSGDKWRDTRQTQRDNNRSEQWSGLCVAEVIHQIH